MEFIYEKSRHPESNAKIAAAIAVDLEVYQWIYEEGRIVSIPFIRKSNLTTKYALPYSLSDKV